MTKVFDATKFRKSITKSIQGLGIGFSDPTDWISTGNYALNYLMTSDFNKGIPLGKVTVLAGESGAGKTEAMKLVLQYVAEVSGKKETDGPSLEEKILKEFR